MRTTTFFGACTLVGLLTLQGAGVASAATGDSCAERYPEAEWSVFDAEGVTVAVSGLSDGLATRFTSEVGIVDQWMNAEIGPVDLTVCLVGGESAFDHTRYREGSQQFHVVSDLEERFFAMNTDQAILYVAPAVAYGISQHALYQNNGDRPFPEPLSSAISHWYRARMINRLPYHHQAQRGFNLFETESIIDWTAGEQAALQIWDPWANLSSIGAFIDFAVAQQGTDVLLSTDGEVWSEIESDWRTSLRIELVGTADPTTGWRGGLIIVISAVTLALVLIAFGLWHKYRRRPPPATAAPIPGFFADS